MDEELKHRSLCSTCNSVSECVHFKRATQAILFCEEYDGSSAAPAAESASAEGRGSDRLRQANPREYKGLCVNCDHRETCVHATQEGGVWHCEEYR